MIAVRKSRPTTIDDLSFMRRGDTPEAEWYDNELYGREKRQYQLAKADRDFAIRLAMTYGDVAFAQRIISIYTGVPSCLHSIAAIGDHFGIKVRRAPVITELSGAPSSFCDERTTSGRATQSRGTHWYTKS